MMIMDELPGVRCRWRGLGEILQDDDGADGTGDKGNTRVTVEYKIAVIQCVMHEKEGEGEGEGEREKLKGRRGKERERER